VPLTAISSFRFTHRSLEPDGTVRLGYALDDIAFEEVFELPEPTVSSPAEQPLLDLLHWVAGVSYYKAAIPEMVTFESSAGPSPSAIRLLHALYSEGLGEFAVVNELERLPNPQFDQAVTQPGDAAEIDSTAPASMGEKRVRRLLVPVGGGKDSAVAIEIARASGIETELFSIGDATPIRESSRVAGLPRKLVTRQIDRRLIELNDQGALNGHVPITAIVSCVALLTAATLGFDAVALANERSASAGNFLWHGVEVNHQFSKSRRVERLLADAVAQIPGGPLIFSLLRPASELSIARAFAGMTQYHPVFTSCNRVFRLDPSSRTTSWCCDCDKCRFVYLILAPFTTPEHLRSVFGVDLLADAAQYDGFALLTATGGEKPFECVGEVDECLAAVQLLGRSPLWSDHAVVRRLVSEVLAGRPAITDAELAGHFTLSDDHDVPDALIGSVREVLRA
jgi:UDP-N-acetyl-alpha-D-muramoyl-L-alanyl-L-glutamate epimerase